MDPLILIDITNVVEYLRNAGFDINTREFPYHLEGFQRKFLSQKHIQNILRQSQFRGTSTKILVDTKDPYFLELISTCSPV